MSIVFPDRLSDTEPKPTSNLCEVTPPSYAPTVPSLNSSYGMNLHVLKFTIAEFISLYKHSPIFKNLAIYEYFYIQGYPYTRILSYKSILMLGIYHNQTQHFFNLQVTFWDRAESAHKAILYRCLPPRSDFVQPNGALCADDGGRCEIEGWRKSGSGARYVMEHASVTQSAL